MRRRRPHVTDDGICSTIYRIAQSHNENKRSRMHLVREGAGACAHGEEGGRAGRGRYLYRFLHLCANMATSVRLLYFYYSRLPIPVFVMNVTRYSSLAYLQAESEFCKPIALLEHLEVVKRGSREHSCVACAAALYHHTGS